MKQNTTNFLIPETPSPLYNNLSHFSNGKDTSLLAFGHLSTAIVVAAPPAHSQSLQQSSSFSNSVLTSISFLDLVDTSASSSSSSSPTKPIPILVVCSTRAVELYSLDQQTGRLELKHSVQIDETPSNPVCRKMYRGSTIAASTVANPLTLLVGSCTGMIRAISLSINNNNNNTSTWNVIKENNTQNHKIQTALSSITCVSSPKEPVFISGYEYPMVFACSDDLGSIEVYSEIKPSSESKDESDSKRWESAVLFAECKSSCNGLCFHQTFPILIAGFSTGHIRLFSLESHSMLLEIANHSRSITSLCIHPVLPIIASSSEDSWIRVWSFANCSKVNRPQALQQPCDIRPSLLFSTHRQSTFWTGLQFISSNNNTSTTSNANYYSLVAVAYDVPELLVYQVPATPPKPNK